MARELVYSSDDERGYMVSHDSDSQWVVFHVTCPCGWEMDGDWCPEYCPQCDRGLTDDIPTE